MKLRDTLTPVSGFQSAPYRKIELASTELINLINALSIYVLETGLIAILLSVMQLIICTGKQ
jgi:hypothetical protein